MPAPSVAGVDHVSRLAAAVKPRGLIGAVFTAAYNFEGVEAYRAAFMASAEAYRADPPAGWDLLGPAARAAMIEGSERTALQSLRVA